LKGSNEKALESKSIAVDGKQLISARKLTEPSGRVDQVPLHG